MANLRLRHRENVPGRFFVDTTCIDCDLCRAIAPTTFTQAGEQSAVHAQPMSAAHVRAAVRALVTCPTASIGTTEKIDAREAIAAYPERIDGNVFFCGFAAESSFGAASYFIQRPQGNVLVDSPRFAGALVRRIEALGGIRWIFLTHRDDVADHEKWARRFGAERILHAADVSGATRGVELQPRGDRTVALDHDLLVVPTPGHTAGHAVLLHGGYLFSGDHVWWSPKQERLIASQRVCWYSWKKQLDSVRRLLDYDFEWILPGHGRRLHAPRDVMRVQLRAILERELH